MAAAPYPAYKFAVPDKRFVVTSQPRKRRFYLRSSGRKWIPINTQRAVRRFRRPTVQSQSAL